jgi:formate hydrogenlyase transcriptional activator
MEATERQMRRWLRDLSAYFIRLPADEIDAGIEAGLREIVEFLDVDRSTLFEFAGDESVLLATHSWAGDGVRPFPRGPFGKLIPWYHNELVSGRTVVLEKLPDDLPPEATAEREYVASEGMRSNLTIPILVGDRATCALAIGAFRRERVWPDKIVDMLRLAGEVLAAALHRSRASREIEQAQVLARDFFDSLDSMAAVVDGDGTIIGVNRAWREGESCGVLMGSQPIGTDYLGTCEMAALGGDTDAARALSGIRSVLARDAPRFLMEYRCTTDDGESWYLLRVLSRSGDQGAVLMHVDITERVRNSARLQQSLEENETLRKLVEEEKLYLQEEIKSEHDFESIVGSSAELRGCLLRVERVAPTDATVLILGETGTGKELLAHAIHERSRRSSRALVKVNCAALPPSLIESELFGHEKGAFTGAVAAKKGRFELANNGTIFLDEIGDLSLELQAKLLRVLQSGEYERVGSSVTRKVDVRVIAATHRDLPALVAEDEFRADLFHRLNAFPIDVPPLRDREEDIPLLVWHFLERCEREWGRKILKVSARVMEALRAYPWPGNVRELKNVIERAVILSPSTELFLDPGSLGPGIEMATTANEDNLDAVQRMHIRRVLEECRWRINGPDNAAERLGLHPNTLRHRLKKLGIARPD